MPKKIDKQSGRITLTLPVKIVAIVVIVAALGVTAYLLFFMPKAPEGATNNPADAPNSTEADKITNNKVIAVSQEAKAAAYGEGGSTEKGVEVYDKAIKKADQSDTVTVAGLYHDKAQLLLNAKDYNAALEAALKAVEVNPGYSSYGILGVIYEQLNDKPKALAAYEKAITYLPSSAGGKEADEQTEGGAGGIATRNYYEERIAALKAGS